MQIDARRQQAAVSSQQAELAAAEAAVSYARQQQQRNSELYTAGAISKQQLEQTETAQRTADANLKALQAQVQQQEVQLRFFTITAPTAGVVGDVPVRVGSQVTPQTLLTTIDQNETLEVNASVPIERAGALKVGLPLQVWSSDGAQRDGGDDRQLRVAARGRSDAVGARQRRGEEPRRRAARRRSTSARESSGRPLTAWWCRSRRCCGSTDSFSRSSPSRQPAARSPRSSGAIKVGPITGDNYPVLEGIKPGERVVVSGAQKLADGAPIQDAPAAASRRVPTSNP